MTCTLASKLTEDELEVMLRSDLRKQEGSRLACKQEVERVLRVPSSGGMALISGKDRSEERPSALGSPKMDRFRLAGPVLDGEIGV